ncbi:MAG: TonB-dependent receptor plug domain-containing protein, partial [Sedimentisphaerales bacterium]|nr:TonB-dependent receptor plug domain-containing protein [Sedimentisphaerales bacterium]
VDLSDISENPEMMLFMDIDDVVSTSLTKTSRRMAPATTTVISREDIAASGARSLDELLEIYVPNYQVVPSFFTTPRAGLRGVISDREDKYLILVNGRLMNEHTQEGALSERDMPMLTDIQRVEVVRGPGSVMYGPGALAMVINIITENAKTYEGTSVISRLGAIEEFYTAEFKHGKKFDENSGLFLYAGIGKYLGADVKDAPIVWGYDKLRDGVNIPAGTAANFNENRYRQAYRDLPKLKFFGQYNNENLDIWLRYTRAGEYHDATTTNMGSVTDVSKDKYYGGQYQQGTAYIKYTLPVSEQLDVDFSFSYDTFAYAGKYFVQMWQAGGYREDEYVSKILARWDLHEDHKVAVGLEWSREIFGLEGFGWPHGEPHSNEYQFVRLPRFRTDMVSLMGEYQWKINDLFTLFLGGRMDKIDLSPDMYSPRATLVFTPAEKDTFKLMASRSMRTPPAAVRKQVNENTGGIPDSEELTSFELRYDRKHNENLNFGFSAFFNEQSAIGYNSYQELLTFQTLGNFKTYGLELDAAYKTDRTKWTFSHSFTKLIDAQVLPGVWTSLTSKPYGEGSDLAVWSNHNTKLTGRYDITEQWSADGSLRILWGYPGAQSYAVWYTSTRGPRPGLQNIHYDRPFDPSVFLSFGSTFELSKQLSIRFDAYNVLGWFDLPLNKRLYRFGRTAGDYRCEAPAFGATLRYEF